KKIDRMGVKTGRTLNENDEVINIADEMSGGKARSAEEVTPDDSNDIDVTNGLYIGTSGDLEVTLEDMTDGESIVFVGLQEGVIHPLKIKRVWDANTTAADIIAIY
ncbi:MAG: spike base protein, RCAP_Rcc01079 family, partial [Bacillota bacterium]